MMSSLPIRSVDDVPRNCDCLVEVKAQVMGRDNVLGMWGPLDGGGMSLVGLYQSSQCPDSVNDICLMQYIIIGHRMSDNRIILNCVVSPSFQYTKVNPTFHHWAVDDCRFGLTFQTFSDASAFEKTVTQVVENLRSLGPQSVSLTTRTNAVCHKSSQSVSKELCTVSEVDERPCLPEKMRCKPNVPHGISYASSTYGTLSPLASADDRIVSVSSLDNIFGQSELSDSLLTRRSSSAEVCASSSSSLCAHRSPVVPCPPRRNAGVALSKPNAELMTCPRRPVRLRGQEQPMHTGLDEIRFKPGGILENAAPPCPITPKVVVKSGIDKKRAQTPPLPRVPLRTSFLNENLLELTEKSAYSDRVPRTFDANWARVCETPSRIGDSSSVYVASSYVQFTKGNVNTYVDKNEYLYPDIESSSSASRQLTGVSSSYLDYRNPGKFTTHPPIPLPSKSPHSRHITKPKDSGKNSDLVRTDSANFKSKCACCGEYYSPKNNRRGACADGPDRYKDCLRKCNCCAQGLLYHCADEEDGDNTDLWTCGACDRRSCRQWTILTLVCLLLPCMWCFLPLRTCHRCGVAFGCCGARHRPMMGPIL